MVISNESSFLFIRDFHRLVWNIYFFVLRKKENYIIVTSCIQQNDLIIVK